MKKEKMTKLLTVALLSTMSTTLINLPTVFADTQPDDSATTYGRIDHKDSKYATYDRNFPKDYVNISVSKQQFINYLKDNGFNNNEIPTYFKTNVSEKMFSIRVFSEKQQGNFDIHLYKESRKIHEKLQEKLQLEKSFYTLVYQLICKQTIFEGGSEKDFQKTIEFKRIMGTVMGISGSDLSDKEKVFFIRDWGFRGYEVVDQGKVVDKK